MGLRTIILKAVKLFPLASPSHPLYAHACLWPLWFQLCCVHPPAEPGNSCMFALSRTCMGGVSCCCMRRGQSLAVTLAAGEVLLPDTDRNSCVSYPVCQRRNSWVASVRISLCKDVISCMWLCPFKFYVLECTAAKSVCTGAECCSWFIEGRESIHRDHGRLHEWLHANLSEVQQGQLQGPAA